MEAQTHTPLEHSRRAVIVMENHPTTRAALAALLSYDGYRPFQAENLGTAIFQIGSVADLAAVLVDLDMPGWRTAMRRVPAKDSVLVIAMEGSHGVVHSELKRRGAQLCLRKPIVYKDVRSAIRAQSTKCMNTSIRAENTGSSRVTRRIS